MIRQSLQFIQPPGYVSGPAADLLDGIRPGFLSGNMAAPTNDHFSQPVHHLFLDGFLIVRTGWVIFSDCVHNITFLSAVSRDNIFISHLDKALIYFVTDKHRKIQVMNRIS
jgi:hypothetical protein